MTMILVDVAAGATTNTYRGSEKQPPCAAVFVVASAPLRGTIFL